VQKNCSLGGKCPDKEESFALFPLCGGNIFL